MQADDDTFVIVENLRRLLSRFNPSQPVMLGHHFSKFISQGYLSGGAGYVISSAALHLYGQRPSGVCATDKGSEDVEFGKCMAKLGVTIEDSRDVDGTSTFHCFGIDTHIQGGYPPWYYSYDKYGARKVSKSN